VKNKKLYCLRKTAPTDPTQTALFWFGSDFILKVNWTKANQTTCLYILRFRWLLDSKPNQTKPNRTGNNSNINPLKHLKTIHQYNFLVLANGEGFINPIFLPLIRSFCPYLPISFYPNSQTKPYCALLKSTYYFEKVCFAILKYTYNETDEY